MGGGNMIVDEALTEENYWYLSDFVKNYLQGQGLWKVIVVDNKDDDWESDNAKALHVIRLACGIRQALIIRECDTTQDAWKRLKLLFDQNYSQAPNPPDRSVGNLSMEYMEVIEAIERGDASALVLCPEAQLVKAIVFVLYPGNNTLIHEAIRQNNEEIVKILVAKAPNPVLEVENDDGYTVLALAAASFGNVRVAKVLIMCNNDEELKHLLCSKAQKGKHKDFIPVVVAADMGYKDLTWLLYNQTCATSIQIFEDNNYQQATSLLHGCINNEIIDVASVLINNTATEWDFIQTGPVQNHPLVALAQNHSLFVSGNQFDQWDKWVYDNLRVPDLNIDGKTNVGVRIVKPSSITENIRDQEGIVKGVLSYILGVLFRRFQHLFVNRPGIKSIYERKLFHNQMMEILIFMSDRISKFNILKLREVPVNHAMLQAAKNGTIEFIEAMSNAKPKLLWESLDQYDRTVLDYAILHRQEDVFAFICSKLAEGDKNEMILNKTDIYGNSLLHQLAILPPASIHKGVSACLQIQRELRWFKKVKEIVNTKIRDVENKEGKRAEIMFAESHKELKQAAEKEIREVASSFLTIGTLIITVMFAVTFTLLGGNNQTSKPILLGHRNFGLFLVAVVVSLFTSSISVLTFIDVLASSYTQEDFLILPKKLSVGVLNLCIGLVSMFIAFSVAFFLILKGDYFVVVGWISVGLAIFFTFYKCAPPVIRRTSQIYVPLPPKHAIRH